MTCIFFAAISGSGPATVAAIGTITIPAMVARGYDKYFAATVVACAGAIGVIIPPAIPLWSMAYRPRCPSASCLSPASCPASSWVRR
ncbi:TRAP transporter large permease subunit [Oceanimonas sp. NS1]|nr:TRAP transporter large permease subunit [Oceanimonas sp. NS1]